MTSIIEQTPVATLDKAAFIAACHEVISDEALTYRCGRVALIVARALTLSGVPARAVGGHTGWAVSPQATGTVVHSVNATPYRTPDAPSVNGHAWVETGKDLIYVTLKSLRTKVSAMDAVDRCVTLVDWAPDYLWVSKFRVPDDEQGFLRKKGSGVYFYSKRPAVAEALFLHCDPDLVEDTAQRIYQMTR
jgi:hypothetical protein